MPTPEHDETAAEAIISRRTLLAAAASAVGGAVLGERAGAAPPQAAGSPAGGVSSGVASQGASPADTIPVPSDATKSMGRIPSSVGRRSQFERPTRTFTPSPQGSSTTPHHALGGTITPADLHFERHHAGIPELDPTRYTLLIHGLVDRPMAFTLADLKRYPSRTQVYFIECSGNGRGVYRDAKPQLTPQQIDGLTSNSEWIGVPLATLLREVGVRQGASWFLAEGGDGAVMTRSIPLSKAMDDAMIAYGQNGEAIRPEQGYPARLLLPGWEGNASVKWLRRIELADAPFMTRQETSKYSDPLADCTARIFSFEMDAKSLITFPAYPSRLAGPGWWEVTGIAWSGRGRITRVDISPDGGRSWAEAELQTPVLPKAHTRFRFMWNWKGGESVLMSRATDETGYIQPTLTQLRQARGLGTDYHINSIRGWRVQADGQVFYAVEA